MEFDILWEPKPSPRGEKKKEKKQVFYNSSFLSFQILKLNLGFRMKIRPFAIMNNITSL